MQRDLLYLYVPGLLGPVPAQARSLIEARSEHGPLVEILDRGRKRASMSGAFGAEAGLCALWGMDAGARDLPLGRLAALAAGCVPEADATVFRAAPVHLVPDRDRLLLFGPERLQLQQGEADTCVDALNRMFAGDGLRFHAPCPHDWYLVVSGKPRLRTVGLARLAGRPMAEGLPTGEDSRNWISRLNEMQMLLHSLSLNKDRQAAGRPLINGVWIWGGGSLPERPCHGWSPVYGDDAVLRGLARFSGGSAIAASDAEQLGAEPRGLVRLPDLPAAIDGEGFSAWEAALGEICRLWISPLVARVRAGYLPCLVLDAGAGFAWHYRPRDRWRIWRRRGSLMEHVLVDKA